MNSSKIRFAAALLFVALSLIVATFSTGCQAIAVSSGAKEKALAGSKGIFGRMIEEVTKPERLEKERHKATMRKKQQLAEAEKEY